MRTTLAIDDELWGELHVYADAKAMSLTRAANEVLARGLRPATPQVVLKHGFPVLLPGSGAARITTEQIRRLEDEAE